MTLEVGASTAEPASLNGALERRLRSRQLTGHLHLQPQMAPTIGGVSKNGMKRADANKPIIYDSMRGEKYVQQRFLGKVRAP